MSFERQRARSSMVAVAMASSSRDNFVRIARAGGRWACQGAPVAMFGRESREDADRWPVGYVTWTWDDPALRAEICPYGVLPVYYYADESQIILADRIATILEFIPTKLDDATTAVLLHLPFSMAGATPLAGVKRLPPGARLKWEDGKLDISTNPPPISEPFTGSRAEAMDRYIELFKAAVSRCRFLLDELAVPISGGRDSRHIALELHAQGMRPRYAYSGQHFPPKSNCDAEIGSQVAARLGFAHRTIQQSDDAFAQHLHHNELVDFCTWEHAWSMPLRAATTEVRATVDGLAGDVFSGSVIQDDAHMRLVGDWDGLATHILNRWEGGATKLLSHEARRRFSRDLAFQTIREEVRRHSKSPHPVREFYFWNRAVYGTGLLPFRIMGHTACVTPFLDPELFTFLRSLPHAIAGDKSFHTDAILRGYPAFADMPFEPASPQPRSDRGFQRKLAVSFARYIAPARRRRWLAPGIVKPLLNSWIRGGPAGWAPARTIYAAQLADRFA